MVKIFVPFNINETVRVKLTDHGRKIHREHFRKLNATIPVTADLKYMPPKEDAEGWSEWQMWCLMEAFGPHIGMCREQPFETSIEFQVEQST